MATEQRTCTFEECDKPHEARGYCNGHYKQWQLGNALVPLRVKMTVTERLDMRTDRSGDCWLWTGSKNADGYGTFRIGDDVRGAHRVAYELAHGPIPGGMMVDHRCHTPACVRPAHLRACSRKQNGENRAGARSGTKSGVRGVSWNAERQKWTAGVAHNSEDFHLGYFATIEEAGDAARVKRLELFTHNDRDRS